MHLNKSNAKKQASKEAGEDTSLSAHYLRQIKFTPIIDGLLKDATMVKKPDIGLVNSASDYSYQSAIYAGPGWRVIGDAGGKLLAFPTRKEESLTTFGSLHRPLLLFGCAFGLCRWSHGCGQHLRCPQG